MKTKWILQTNIFKEEAVDRFIECLKRLDVPYELIQIIPFDDKLPKIESYDGPMVAYGTTTLLKNIKKDKTIYPGMWFNEDEFKPTVWGKQYGDLWLNKIHKCVKVKDALSCFTETTPLFIRPDSDFKLFTGDIFYKYDFEMWYEKIKEGYYVNLKPNTEVILSPVYNIFAEWRYVIIDKKVITSSMYQRNHGLNVSGNRIDIDEGATKLANKISKLEYQPSEAYVIDVCKLANNVYKIIEVNCLNASGLYNCDVASIIYHASLLAEKQWRKH
jgi:hypothetical protein